MKLTEQSSREVALEREAARLPSRRPTLVIEGAPADAPVLGSEMPPSLLSSPSARPTGTLKPGAVSSDNIAPSETTIGRILLVDDDPMLRLLAAETLCAADFEVIEAADGRAALTLAARHRPDLILLDVMMPGVDGYEVCRQLRSLPATATTPIIMMTGLDDGESINRAYEIGATDFVTKPINYTLLSHRLRYVLRAATAFTNERNNAARLVRAQTLAKLAQWELDQASRRFRWSPEAETIFGIPSAEVDLERALLAWVHKDDRERVLSVLMDPREGVSHALDFRLIPPDGRERVVHQEAAILVDPIDGHPTLVGSSQDVTALRNAEKQVHALAYYDSLTRLPNRAFLRRYLTHIVASSKRYDRFVAVLALDLDGFKRVNDTFGHSAGDELLCQVAQRISDCIRGSDVLVADGGGSPTADVEGIAAATRTPDLAARLGGDEFVIVLTDLRRPEDAGIVAQKIADKLARGFKLSNGAPDRTTEAFVTSSIGIATYPEHGDDVDDLLDHADVAMYHAKENGRNAFHFFTDAMQQRARVRLAMENGLRATLAALPSVVPIAESAPIEVGPSVRSGSDESFFELHYQPKVEVPSGRIVGAEALLRWTTKDGPISPADFIPVAEDTGLIIPLGAWVLRTACEQAQAWVEMGRPLRVAVNVSARQFREPDFTKLVAEVLAITKLEPSLLELEITEGMVMDDTAASQSVLADLKNLGVRIALDDFGTGYSSLSYLTRLPIDALKIDRSFIRALGSVERGETITAAIIALSQSLSIDVVVEGVENEEQLAFVNSQGTAEVQGFFFAQPMQTHKLMEWCLAHELSLSAVPVSRLVA